MNSYLLKIELDISGGTTYSEIGTIQMISVPYALYAKHVSTKDMIGVNMAAIKALEKRTKDLQQENDQLKNELENIKLLLKEIQDSQIK